jgi:hypothetical protein
MASALPNYFMENLLGARQRIASARTTMDEAQTSRVKAAGTLLRKLSMSNDEVPKQPSRSFQDADSLPSSPVKQRVALKEKAVFHPNKPSSRNILIAPSSSSSSSVDSVEFHDNFRAKRRDSLSSMLFAAKTSARPEPTKPRPVQPPSPISSPHSESSSSHLPDSALLRRGQACHRFFVLFQSLNIPSNTARLRNTLRLWRKPDPKILEYKLSPIVCLVRLRDRADLALSFSKLQINAMATKKLKTVDGVDSVVEYHQKAIQTDARRQFDTLIGLGKLAKCISKLANVHLAEFFAKLRLNRKKQMEIAFLRAVIGELKRREI